MSEDPPSEIPAQPDPNRPQHMSARVPDEIGPGAFSTGIIVMTGGTEFVVDFIQNLGPPAQVAARVVMPHATMPQFIDALNKNLEIYSNRFGAPTPLPPAPQPERPPTAQEIYDDLKLPDELLSGSYANGVMIGHSATEFKFDFLTNLFPHPAVSCRVFMSAPQVPRMRDSLSRTLQQFQQRVQQKRENQPDEPPEDPPIEPPPNGGAEGTK